MGSVTGEFYDDSSSKLGLSHRSSTAPPAEVFERGRLPGAGNLRTTEIAERTAIIEAEKAKREADIAKLVASHGMTRRQAAEVLDRERGNDINAREHKREQRDDRRRREIENLADHRKKPARHSSGSKSKFKTVKPGTLVCAECHLECKTACECPGCQCVPCRRYRGFRGDQPGSLNRTIHGTLRKSEATAATLDGAGLSDSDALEVAAIALETGSTYADAARTFKRQRRARKRKSSRRRQLAMAPKPDCQACPDQARGLMCIACSKAKIRSRKGAGVAPAA